LSAAARREATAGPPSPFSRWGLPREERERLALADLEVLAPARTGPLSYDEISELVGLSADRVRQISAGAIEKMRRRTRW
jgi:DNA-directed RNA polymerase sigma subunit (sigma70/sigma32)